jgi:hypothetical protein
VDYTIVSYHIDQNWTSIPFAIDGYRQEKKSIKTHPL